MGRDGRVVKGRGDASAAGWSRPFSSFPRNRLPPCVGKEAFPLVRTFHLLSLIPIPGVNVDLGALAKDLMGSSLVFSPIFEVFLVCTTKG